jgi:hypothetical protein
MDLLVLETAENYRMAAQLLASRAVLSSTELVSLVLYIQWCITLG